MDDRDGSFPVRESGFHCLSNHVGLREERKSKREQWQEREREYLKESEREQWRDRKRPMVKSRNWRTRPDTLPGISRVGWAGAVMLNKANRT